MNIVLMYSPDDELTRISAVIERDMLAVFETLLKESGHSSRSEGIREAMELYLREEEQMSPERGQGICVVLVVIDHRDSRAVGRLCRVQLDYQQMISAEFNFNLENSTSLRALVMGGNNATIKEFAGKSLALRGIADVKMTLVLKAKPARA